MAKFKIGHNPSANMLPMFYYLDNTNPLFELVTEVPTGHNRLLAAGKIDMAPISTFSFGEHWDKYSILSGLSVSAKAKIDSILLYSKFELKDLDGRVIALTDTSATSVNLLKIILERFYQVKPAYVTMAPDLDSMLEKFDAALLIADEALAGLSRNTGCIIYDLSQEWYKHTGLPMVFAVWAVSNRVLAESPEEVGHVHSMLVKSKEMGLQNIDKIIDRCITSMGNDYKFWSAYFSQLRYGLEPELLEGLETYFGYCTELGLLPSRPFIKLWP